jgi:catechol 2,3-dioxygenase-like lactoylglutathione lyase family enzyme
VRITRVLHASVNVAGELDDAASFYRDVLGLDTTWRPEVPGVPGAWFDIADVQLHLVGSNPLPEGIDPGAHHFCVGVADLDATVAELGAAGIDHVEGSQDHHGKVVRQVWIRDPAGNVIEFQQDPQRT